jgi:SAM-dependent methyltransferase
MAADPDAALQAGLWDKWAAAMPELYPDRDPSLIVEFLSAFGPGESALELGAGTGRVALPLSRRSRRVVCIEISGGLADQLEEARGDLDVHVLRTDMAAFDARERFALVYCVRSTFFHLGTQERQIEALQCARTHLAPHGRLVLDCFVPDLNLLQRRSEVTLNGWSDDCADLRACTVDTVSQRVTYREIRLCAGVPPRVLPVEQRYCWPAELDVMARLAGLELEDRYGDFAGSVFTDHSRRHVSVYRAARSADDAKPIP